MRALRHTATFGAAVIVLVSPAAVFGTGKAAAADTMAPLREALRRCDFSPLGTVPMLSRPESGDGTAVIRGMVTIQENIRPGSTGLWVIVERPNANSQNPAEFYTSEFVAPV